MKTLITTIVILVLGTCMKTGSLIAAEKPKASDIQALVQAGKQTAERYLVEPSSWTVLHELPSEETIEIKMVSDTDRTSWSFSSIRLGQTNHICRFLETYDAWYVIEEKRVTKYRPREAELPLPSGYELMDWSQIMSISSEEEMEGTVFYRRDKGIYHYYIPLDKENRAALAQNLRGLEAFRAQGDKSMESLDMKKVLEVFPEFLYKGIPQGVYESSGLLAHYRRNAIISRMKDFRFMQDMPTAAFAIPPDREMVDLTKPLTATELEKYILVQRDPRFTADLYLPGTDGYLFNPATGERRRLPYYDNTSIPVGFLADRTEVLVIGGNITEDRNELFKIDLKTQEHTAIEHDIPEGISLLSAALSPDGKKLAIVQQSLRDVQKNQVRILDLETGKSKLLGKEEYMEEAVSWLPDGKGVIVNRISYSLISRADRIKGNVVRLELTGKSKVLMPGNSAIVLPRWKKLLYREIKTGLWHTSDLDGKNSQLYANGLKDHIDPAISPDGTQIFFSLQSEKMLPRLTLFEFGRAEGKPVSHLPGYLSKPVW